ncbi:mapk-regulated corepressor-interacting protein 1 [Agrilus planipennis]|uniref:Mapk-regulated corepressor-interacting protein 1 n=1 Tax=Agrilus planipennis TaxID=224129 RepID=A0A1W4XUA5_AGRPL|nr:mapk-regulated corepressor-interacting protein 1 [Agrilus planipennis]
MYNIKGPSKIVAKSTRRGISQNLDNLHNQHRSKVLDSNENEIVNGPKPIFQSKKCANNRKCKDNISPHHEKLITYINESWNLVASELNSQQNNNNKDSTKKSQMVMYFEESPCTQLQDFKPFDLESWWGRRLYTKITNSTNSKN